MAKDGRRCGALSESESQVIGKNVRALRQRAGWSQRHLASLMGFGVNASIVCRIERATGDGRRRGLTADELCRFAAIFDVSSWQLATSCVTCKGQPPPGFSCLTCGARREARPHLGGC
jgi:transcriptional regulator with XRE-family HTH domain